ncbi:hypothetical protein JL720_17396 [Aureococcus anophagefferens]|nr:hypothetical protein JL720_17396 [Aureococcus anophagefferens]
MYSNKLILVALAATVTVSESACTNDKWMINNKRSKNCDWVAKKSSRCQKKGKNGKGNKVEANVACQE